MVWRGSTMIAKATQIAYDADIFVVVGTSMVVYPAAGLIDVVPLSSQNLSLTIPSVRTTQKPFTIEKPTTQGVKELQEILRIKIT